ncbi:uncharacterized protein LOC132946918 [Metopolophium dirhodum]|uniref:uncharacterized protein LOC132946918 n=1 Tax=Metopolophium dirhodum TaxID=44670 RepID=UPI0029904901|nr:uncharacterized protein LOC132946918 [Metopolophium dirhodum]
MVLWNKIVLFLISLCMVALCDSAFQKPLDPFTLLRYDKRTPEDQPPNNEKNISVEFDEYPVIVPKRTALLLDRLMVALQKAVDGNNSGNMKGYYPERSIPISGAPRPSPGMELQRRNQQKGRLYWRCYFNAVSCFK